MDYSAWIKKLDAEEKAHDEFRKKARKVHDLFRLSKDKGSRFPILWSNTQVLSPAVYGATPVPDVRKRFTDSQPASKTASMVIERALSFIVDVQDFDAVMKAAVTDFLVPALGQVKCSYEPVFVPGAPERIALMEKETEEGEREYYDVDERVDSPMFDEMGAYTEGPEIPELVAQGVSFSVIPWDRFCWEPAKDWDSVGWAAEVHYLTEDELFEQFGDIQAPLEYSEAGKKAEQGDRAKVYEIWCKRSRKHFALIRGLQECLYFKDSDGNDIEHDELGLSGFFPFPRPMMCNTVAGDLTPMPDFCYYQEQAAELNEVTGRIEKLTKALKYRGVYDSSFEDGSVSSLASVANADDNEFTPIPNLSAKLANAGGRGLDAVIATMPLNEIRAVVMDLVGLREQIKQSIYEITGISDIVRGSTKATETLGAQQLKGQFANMRLSDKQGEVARFCRDLFRIAAEIIGEHFEPDVLEMMTGLPVTPDVEAILRSDVLRVFNVDVETDSTILNDQSIDQKNRTEAARVMMEGIGTLMPMVAQGLPGSLALELLQFAVGGFKIPKSLEDEFSKLSDGNGAAPGAGSMAVPQIGPPVQPGMQDVGAIAG